MKSWRKMFNLIQVKIKMRKRRKKKIQHRTAKPRVQSEGQGTWRGEGRGEEGGLLSAIRSTSTASGTQTQELLYILSKKLK